MNYEGFVVIASPLHHSVCWFDGIDALHLDLDKRWRVVRPLTHAPSCARRLEKNEKERKINWDYSHSPFSARVVKFVQILIILFHWWPGLFIHLFRKQQQLLILASYRAKWESHSRSPPDHLIYKSVPWATIDYYNALCYFMLFNCLFLRR